MFNSKLVREVGLSDGIVIHAVASQKANPAYAPATEAALEQQAASPVTLLSQQVRYWISMSCCLALRRYILEKTPVSGCPLTRWLSCV